MKKNERWNTRKGYSVLNSHKERVIKLYEDGKTLEQIGNEFGISRNGVRNWLVKNSDYPHRKDELVECALLECKKKFVFKRNKVCCSRKHIKRLNARGYDNNIYVECRLPECEKLVIKGSKNSYCKKSHGDRHMKRYKTGFYDRLKNRNPCCFVCGEWRVVDSHHILHKNGKSDKNDPTVWICPTHHLAIHRKLAYIDKKTATFHWLDEKILKNLDE